MTNHIDSNKRDFLIKLLATGALAASPLAFATSEDNTDSIASRTGKSIYKLVGKVLINGKIATEDTIISPSDAIITTANSQLTFVVGKDAFILRENSELLMSESERHLVGSLRLTTGALLSVFGKSEHKLSTNIATIGIRGTGVYLEAHADTTYVCTCYGITEISSHLFPEKSETIVSHHHTGRYVNANGTISTGPFINHTDDELMLIESLVGRKVPF